MLSVRIVVVSLFVFFVLAPLLHADQNQAEALIADAWKGWEKGDRRDIEKKFDDALKVDPDNPRALLGLALLYEIERRYNKSWEMYSRALKKLPIQFPYLYATWGSTKFRNYVTETEEGLSMLTEIAQKGDKEGIIRTMANQLLANLHANNNDFEKSSEYYNVVNAVRDWQVIGPFDNTASVGHKRVYEPEKDFKIDAQYIGRIGVPVTWFKPTVVRSDGWIDFMRYFEINSGTFYANTFVYIPTSRRVQLRIGTAGTCKLFLNDELVTETIEEYDTHLDAIIAEVNMQQGWNRILVKSSNYDKTGCNFLLRITDSSGASIPDLKINSAAQSYTPHANSQTNLIEHFAEKYFKEQIKQYPDRLENYLLLADTYLYTDHAEEAEMTLIEALKKSPNSVIVYDALLGAYSTGDKRDEISKTLDKIFAIDTTNLSALQYKFYEHMRTEEYDKAEQFLNQYEQSLYDPFDAYSMRIDWYAKKELSDKMLDLMNKGYERDPMNPVFVKMQALLLDRVHQNRSAAIKLLKSYTAKRANVDMLEMLAGLHLEESDMESWREVYDRIHQLIPASTIVHNSMARVYMNLRDYDNAEQSYRKCLELMPGSSYYWARLGELEQNRNRPDAAILRYRTSLLYDPTDYEVRETLRDLERKPSPFDAFARLNIDSVLLHARTTKGSTDEPAEIFLERAQHVIYEHGASESRHEMVVKVLNGRGIDNWKEFVIPVNTYSQELIVDKAVVIKDDASETKADEDDNFLVFKGLEENNVLYIKWRVKNRYSGILSRHYWDNYNFSSFYPSQFVSYELMTPANFAFKYTTQNMTNEPQVTELDSQKLYRWTLSNIPAISYEYGMPVLEDIGQVLHISSMKDWKELINWYSEITEVKSRTSYEIREKTAELLKGKEQASDEEKMKIIYNFITESIRYSHVAFRQGRYIPQKARDVLVNRIGDCKDVATLCIAMLREAGMKAHYVLVNTRDEGFNRQTLPSIAFNHCIVGIETRAGKQFLDLTANNFPIGTIPEGDAGAFALEITPTATTTTYLPEYHTIPRKLVATTLASFTTDNNLKVQQTSNYMGTPAASFRSSMRDQSQKDQEKSYTAFLNKIYSNAKLLTLQIKKLDELTSDIDVKSEFEIQNYLTEAGDFKLMKLPWITAENNDEGLSYEKREFTYDMWPFADTVNEEIQIRVPEGLTTDIPKPVHFTSPVAEYSLAFTNQSGVLIARRSFVYKKRVVMPTEYEKTKTFFNNVIKEDTRQILLKPATKEAEKKKKTK